MTLRLPEIFVEALTSRAIAIVNHGRLDEARILLEAAAARAHTEQLYASALRAENNLGSVLEVSDRYEEAIELVERAITLARRRGDRRWESLLRTGGLFQLVLLGRWDETLAIAAEEEPLVATEIARANILQVALLLCERGDPVAARAMLTAAEALAISRRDRLKIGGVGARGALSRLVFDRE